jgi:hypothetical protein
MTFTVKLEQADGTPTDPPTMESGTGSTGSERAALVHFLGFGLDGSFIGTIHLIRADLYRGQPCPQAGGLYFFIPPIGYYRCEHF